MPLPRLGLISALLIFASCGGPPAAKEPLFDEDDPAAAASFERDGDDGDGATHWSAVDRVEPSQYSPATGTGTGTGTDTDTDTDTEDAIEAAPLTTENLANLSLEWAVSRNQLDKVLDLGPGAFLSTVEVRASFNGERFAGWEIVRLTGNLGRVGFNPGDVVSRVNGKSIQRPAQLQELWDSLRRAQAIEVVGHRSGAPFTRRFPIEGSTTLPPSP